MKKNRIIRLLGLTLSVVIATSNVTSVVYAAEVEEPEVIVEEVQGADPEVIPEEQIPEEVTEEEGIVQEPEVVDDEMLDHPSEGEAAVEEEKTEADVLEGEEPDMEAEESFEEDDEDNKEAEEESPMPILTFSSEEEVKTYLESHPSNGMRLLVFSDAALEEYYEAVEVATHSGLWMLTYADVEAASEALRLFTEAGFATELDTSVEGHEEEQLSEEVAAEVLPEESVEVISEATKEEAEEAAPVEKEVVVALIDTGVNPEDALLENRLVEGIPEGLSDPSGHGTTMAEIVASQTGDNVKILPLAAFGENGISTVAKVYFAIEEAIAKDVDVINISASGLGKSKVLTKAISDAKARNIPVVVAAGNDATDAASYMPGNVEDAITITATDKERAFAEYSNFGDGVDFSAMGILVKDMGTEDESDDIVYQGTSIASAYASAYAALLLSNEVEEGKEVDVYASFAKSAADLGEEGRDAYYGEGYLEKENLVVVCSDGEVLMDEAPEEDMEELLEEEGEEELASAYTFATMGREFDSICYAVVGQTTVNGRAIGTPGDHCHVHVGTYAASPTSSAGLANACGCGENHPWRTANGFDTKGVLSRNPADKVVFNNCTFYNCWTEFFFDVEYNNCTFYNCNFSNNGGCNTITFNYCNVNPSGFSGLRATQARSDGSHCTYAGILGGLSTRWVLNGTTVNGVGATCAVSDNCAPNVMAGFTPGVYLMNGSVITGGSVCGVDVWQNGSPNVEVKLDSSSRVQNAPVGIYNQGYAYINSGSITGCGDTAVANYHVATVSGGTLSGNGVGVRNWGTLAVNGGNITSNTTGVVNAGNFTQGGGRIFANRGNGVENGNTYTKTGGEVRDNASWGIVNNATTNIVSDRIANNRGGGVYQNGTLYMSGNGVVSNGNVIYLTPGHVVTVNGPLNSASAGTINTGVGDRATGRLLVNLYAADTSVGENVAGKFALAFQQNDNTHTQDVFQADGNKVVSAGEPVASIIRAGYGADQNAEKNQVILSGKYYASFEKNLNLPEEIKIHIPYTYNELYFGEKRLPNTPNHAYTTGGSNTPAITFFENEEEKDITQTLEFKGWALDAKETDTSRIYTTEQVMAKYGDFHWYAIWDACFDLYFDGNKQNRGENYQLNEFHMDTPLPGNVGPEGTAKNYFGKEDVYKAVDKTWYDENKEAFVDMTVPYSYQGWSLRKDATYKDSDVVNPENGEKDTLGETLGVGSYNAGAKWLIEKIKNGETKGFDEDGRAILPIYVVWDQAPVIEAYDLYVTKNEIEDLGEEPFWENVTARDREDGTLEDKVDVTIVNFDKSELEDVEGDRGGVSVTYRAEDGAGNVTFYTVMVNVISNTAMTSWTPNADGSKRDSANYVRFIDRENYNKHVTAEGGMEEHSVWYTNPEYVEEITQAFDHLDNKTSIVSYELNKETMQAMQEYRAMHKQEVLETTYQANFYRQFLAPNVSRGALN